MTRSSAVRKGLPLRRITLRIVIPLGLVLIALVAAIAVVQYQRIEHRMTQDQRATVRTLFESSELIAAPGEGLATIARNRGFQRVWVLSATGDILDSNLSQEIGQPLDARWWHPLRDLSSGLHQQTIQFGNQRLLVTSLTSVEQGRHVVVVSAPINVIPRWLAISGGVLVLSLILWIAVFAWFSFQLARHVARPIQQLDERSLDLVRGGSLTEAAWDRVLAETSPQLAGHAECVVDLGRKVRQESISKQDAHHRFQAIFDLLPDWALIRLENGQIPRLNMALATHLGVEPELGLGSMAALSDHLPTAQLERWVSSEAASHVGIRNVSMQASTGSPLSVSISPLKWHGQPAHVILVRSVATSDAPVSERNAQTPHAESDVEPEIPLSDHAARPSRTENEPSWSGDGSGRPGDLSVSDLIAEIRPASPRRTPAVGSSAPSMKAETETSAETETLDPESTTADSREDASSNASPNAATDISMSTNPGSDQGVMTDVLAAAGFFVVAFDSQAQTVFWSPAAAKATGLEKDDIPDLPTFANKLFSQARERELFQTWLDSEPDERSQELRIRTKKGLKKSRWYATETQPGRETSIGVLWAELEPGVLLSGRSRPEN